MTGKRKFIGNITLFFCAIAWGMAFAFQRKAANGINPIAFNGLRFVMAFGVILIFYVVYSRIRKKLGSKTEKWNKSTIIGGVLCGVCLFLASNLQQYGIKYVSAGRAGFITTLYIVLVPLFGLLAGRRTNVFSRFAIPVALAGFWIMCSVDSGGFGYGELLSIAATVFFALQILFIDIFGEDADPIKITLVQFFTSSVLSVIGMAIVGFPTAENINANIGSLIYVGVVSAGIGYTLQSVGQRFTDPLSASLIMSLESVIGMIGGVIVLQETHSVAEMCGCMLVFIAVVLSQLNFPKTMLQPMKPTGTESKIEKLFIRLK